MFTAYIVVTVLLYFLFRPVSPGLSLIAASRQNGIVVLANHEEERFSEVKHYVGYPAKSVEEMIGG